MLWEYDFKTVRLWYIRLKVFTSHMRGLNLRLVPVSPQFVCGIEQWEWVREPCTRSWDEALRGLLGPSWDSLLHANILLSKRIAVLWRYLQPALGPQGYPESVSCQSTSGRPCRHCPKRDGKTRKAPSTGVVQKLLYRRQTGIHAGQSIVALKEPNYYF